MFVAMSGVSALLLLRPEILYESDAKTRVVQEAQ
jgi:hypothetical protein